MPRHVLLVLLGLIVCVVRSSNCQVYEASPGDLEDLEDWSNKEAERAIAPDGLTQEEYCSGCQKLMEEVDRQLDIKETRTTGEVVAYLNEMCEDLEGWFPDHVIKVCRKIIPAESMTISGLIQLAPGNLASSACSMYLGACPKEDREETLVEEPSVDTNRKKKKKKNSAKKGKTSEL
mmetsp:Transcript_38410/g.46329  ORF Transcript_38410/g.46329 Transcript_38410/m.46329 type:complete len:177 (+) Transcript_38410:216-746(+)|eukprot:CAMPEP_0197863694 /NCGR_PEP_ID=MMETSP1438-20131217/41357_1 /TAXON_ID=1461541 /ORGANISM="Pterosperma sp., Strain CCMP1384" /LENGTH=176 /DNA_ID=CAMNT_0043481693 /DNA_START=203 /DNA_END=733 /DNA_ORIENTATION=-